MSSTPSYVSGAPGVIPRPPASVPDVAVEVEGLTRTYGDRRAVDGVSFRVLGGEIFGLLGPNGAGKTTTLSMLTGVVAPTTGAMRILGVDPLARPAEAKRCVGLVPQTLALYPTLTARDNLAFFGRIYGLHGRRLRARVDEVLEVVALTDRGDDAIETFSGGMKRRINMAAGLMHAPRVLLLDEPTVGVDPQSRNAIFGSIESLNRQGVTVVYTTHYMEEAQRLCHRVAIMDAGRIVALDTPAALSRMVGEGFFRIGVGAGDEADLIRALEALPSVKSVSRHGALLEVDAHALQDAVVGLMEVAARLRVRVASLNIFESNLEAVFLKLTGKRLRDD